MKPVHPTTFHITRREELVAAIKQRSAPIVIENEEPTDAKMVDSRAHRRIADYAVGLSRDRVQAGGVTRRSHDRL
jgi:hypothetical protein